MTTLIRKGGGLVLGAGLVLLTGGCPLLSIEAEIPEVCLTYRDFEVPASDGSGTYSAHVTYDDLGSLGGLDGIEGQIEVTYVKLVAKSGVSQLDFVDAAHITLTGDPALGLPDLGLVDCAGDCPSGGSELVLDASAAADAFAYLEGDSIGLTIDVAGDLPTQAWTADVVVCMKATVGYTFEP